MQDPSGPFVLEHACAELTALLPALEAVVEMPHCDRDGLPVTRLKSKAALLFLHGERRLRCRP